MNEQKCEKIINIVSIHSTINFLGISMPTYCTSKSTIWLLTKTLVTERTKYNITVNTIKQRYFLSELTNSIIAIEESQKAIKRYCPMSRVGCDDELDEAITYFTSDTSSYTTGQLLIIDDNWTTLVSEVQFL